jgi:hypothetical protein
VDAPRHAGPRDRALERARERLGLDRSTPATAVFVDGAGEEDRAYHLVVFGEPMAAVGVATLDAASGELSGWAALPGTGPHLLIGAREARERAGVAPDTRARLMWTSSRASRSPLYPFWALGAGDHVAYVDQQGTVWRSLREDRA